MLLGSVRLSLLGLASVGLAFGQAPEAKPSVSPDLHATQTLPSARSAPAQTPLPRDAEAAKQAAEEKSKREEALRHLQLARALATGAEPAAAVDTCSNIARAFERLDKAQAVSTYQDCFRRAQEIGDDGPETAVKFDVTQKTLRRLAELSPAVAKSLMPQADIYSRAVARSVIVRALVQAAKFDDAIAELRPAAADGAFPSGAALNLSLSLPPARSADIAVVYRLGVQSLPNGEWFARQPRSEDFAELTVRLWQMLPPNLVLEGVDAILKTADEADAARSGPRKDIPLTAQLGQDAQQFVNMKQFRLFELLPVLRVLDPSRVKSLVAADPVLAAKAVDHPEGLADFNPSIKEKDPKKAESARAGGLGVVAPLTGGPSPNDIEQIRADGERVVEIEKEAGVDLDKALADAKAMPDRTQFAGPSGTSRVEALLRVAKAAGKAHLAVAHSALAAVQDGASGYAPELKVDVYLRVLNAYTTFGDREEALRLLDKVVDLGGDLYREDRDDSDPNRATRSHWPSAAVWTAAVMMARRLSPTDSDRLLADVAAKDPVIGAAIHAAVAAEILGLPLPFLIAESEKKSPDSRQMGGVFLPPADRF